MRSRLHFMGNGYAGQLLDLIRNGRSMYTSMSVYDFMAFKMYIGSLDGASLNGNELTVYDSKGSFVTKINSSPGIADGRMRFTERYSLDSYLLFDGLQDNGYLLTENDELLLV